MEDAEPVAGDDAVQTRAAPKAEEKKSTAAEKRGDGSGTATAAAITGSGPSSSSTSPAPTSGKDLPPADEEGLFLRVGRFGASKYAGVGWAGGRKQRWHAQLKNGGRNEHLGYFKEEKEAARAWTNYKRKLLGMPPLGQPVSEQASVAPTAPPSTSPPVPPAPRAAPPAAPAAPAAAPPAAPVASPSAPPASPPAASAPPATLLSAASPAALVAPPATTAAPPGAPSAARSDGDALGETRQEADFHRYVASSSPFEADASRPCADPGNAASSCPLEMAAIAEPVEQETFVEALVDAKTLKPGGELGAEASGEPRVEMSSMEACVEDDLFDLLLAEADALKVEEREGKKKKKEKKEKKDKEHKKEKKEKKEKKAAKQREELQQEMDEDGLLCESVAAITGSSAAAASSSEPPKSGTQAKRPYKIRTKFAVDQDGLLLNDRVTSSQTSVYMGVSLMPNGKWGAQGKVGTVNEFLGAFAAEKEAAAAYTSWKFAVMEAQGVTPKVAKASDEVDGAHTHEDPGKLVQPTTGNEADEAVSKGSRQANGTQSKAKKTVEAVSKDAKSPDIEETSSDSDAGSASSSSSGSAAQQSRAGATAAGEKLSVQNGLRVLTYRDAVEWWDAQRAAALARAPGLPAQPGTPGLPAPGTPGLPAPGTPAWRAPGPAQPGTPGLPAPGTPAWRAPGTPARHKDPQLSQTALQSLAMSTVTAMPAALQPAVGASAPSLAPSPTSSASSGARDRMPSQALHPLMSAGVPVTSTPRPAPTTPSITASSGILIDEDDAYDSIFAETQIFSSIQHELETLLLEHRLEEPVVDADQSLNPESKRRKDEWEAMCHIEPGAYLTGPVSEEEEVARQQEFELNRLWEQEMSLAREANQQQQQRHERLRRKRKALSQTVAPPASAWIPVGASSAKLTDCAAAVGEVVPLRGAGDD